MMNVPKIIKTTFSDTVSCSAQQLRVFNIQDDHEKKICPFRPLNDFFTQYKTILGDLIEDNPLMFPKVILKTGKISLCQPINHRTITELIKRICQDTDQSDSIGTYKYNTHFMRRGGAQYRYQMNTVFQSIRTNNYRIGSYTPLSGKCVSIS